MNRRGSNSFLEEILGKALREESLSRGEILYLLGLEQADQIKNLFTTAQGLRQRYFGDKVFRVVVPRNVRLSEAPSYGQPVLMYDIASRGAQAYMDLAQEVLAGGAHG